MSAGSCCPASPATDGRAINRPVTASLPQEVREAFGKFVTSEYVTIDSRQQPIVWPVTPYYENGAPCIDVTTGIGYPKKALDAKRNPQVALLFSDTTGSGIDSGIKVLVQGTADIDDRDLVANRERYWRESGEKLPATKEMHPPKLMRGLFNWYYTRVYVHVRPERVFVWPNGDPTRPPEVLDAHMDEVRSGHSEEPLEPLERPSGGRVTWDPRIEELDRRYETAAVGWIAPDGFPLAARLPVGLDRDEQRIVLGAAPAGFRSRRGVHASPRTATARTSPGRRTSRCAATSSRPTAAGRSFRASSWAGSSSPTRARPPVTGGTWGSRSASTRRLAATARRRASEVASARRERRLSGVPGPRRIRVNPRLLDLLADALKQPSAVRERGLEIVAGPPPQPPQEPELAFGDAEVDLVVDRRHPAQEAGAEGLPQRHRVVLARHGRQEALVEVDALELHLAARRALQDELVRGLLDRLDVERRHHLGEVRDVGLREHRARQHGLREQTALLALVRVA